MILTIFRHGEAGEAATDRARELTEKGVQDVERGATAFLETCRRRVLQLPERVYHSPWVRTTSTAELICRALDNVTHTGLPAIQPGGDVAGVQRWFEENSEAMRDDIHLVLVSHQPLVSHMVDYYLGEGGAVPSLSPGAFATLSMGVPGSACGSLQFWAMPPGYEVNR
ncbi:MAG: phosphohistidine phosphatase SixA [Halioglobus sp.]|nr:phosphohistidine phosphatase SixA [Halioglobus sp.]